MHSNHSIRVRYANRLRQSSRSSSTTASVKPAPSDLRKWTRPRPSPPAGENSSPTPPNLGKWARLPSTSAAGPSYTPNLGKWARKDVPQPQPRRKSVLDALDTSNRSSTPRNVLDGRSSSDPQGKQQSSQGVPEFPAEPFGDKLERGVAPHLLPQEKQSTQTIGEFPADVSTDKPSPSAESFNDKLERGVAPHLSPHIQARVGIEGSRDPSEQSSKDLEVVKADTKQTASSQSTSSRRRYLETYEPVENNYNEQEVSRRQRREVYKDRGSVTKLLEEGDDIEIRSNSWSHQETFGHTKKSKKETTKPVIVDVAIPSVVSVQNLARILGVRIETLQNCMQRNGMEELSSHDHILTADDASLLAMEFDRNPVVDDEGAFDIYTAPPHPDYASLPRRPPVVTIMGHVDHGKTTLLDTLRSSSVAKGEAGGITQHIGAFSVPVPSTSASSDKPQSITFLDTPGHAAFSAMRARGARVTDIIVLVVAADDGVMPQTKEVIELIKKEKGKVGVVVAINKVDKPGADVEKVQNALWAEGIELEVMGGEVPSVEVSGLTGHGLEQLVETISIFAELQDMRAEVDGPAHGYILESKLVKGFGNTATLLLLRGKLTPSAHIVSGTTHAKIRQLTDSFGLTVKVAGPGTAVVVSGWKELPSVGDEVLEGKERDVKLAAENRKRKASLASTLADAEAINASRRREREERERQAMEALKDPAYDHAPSQKEEGPRELRLVIKGDVSGSIEALADAVQGIGNNRATVKVVSTGIGEVTESDIMLAKASEAMIVAFSIGVSRIAEKAASQNEVAIYRSKVIYSVLDEVKERVVQLLPKTLETRVTGEATVIELFDITGRAKSIIRVAGCRVSNGIVQKDKPVRVLRNGEIIHMGTLSTLRILKRDVLEAKKGLECGISIKDFSDLSTGDLLQFYQEIEMPGHL